MKKPTSNSSRSKSNPPRLRPHRNLNTRSKAVGEFMIEAFHLLALFAIGSATIWAAGFAFIEMVQKGHANVEDLLLLFIYLEIGAMVGIYFKTNRMPVRFLIYVAITALTRHMISFVNVNYDAEVAKSLDYGVLIMAGAILLLAIALLLLRFGSHAYPSEMPVADSNKDSKPDI